MEVVDTMRKRGVLQLALQLNFWVVEDICNSLYLYTMNVDGQAAWVAKLQLTIDMMQLITIQLQFCQNNSFSTTMQLHYNYTHDVMLMWLIVIHILKFDTWHYENFWIEFFFQNIDFHCLLWLLMMVRDCDMWHNNFFATWHINYILE